MSDPEELTFIQKIEKYRTFAHRPISSDSDSSNDRQKSDFSNESNNSFGDTHGRENARTDTSNEPTLGENQTADDSDSVDFKQIEVISASCVIDQDASQQEGDEETGDDGEPTTDMNTLFRQVKSPLPPSDSDLDDDIEVLPNTDNDEQGLQPRVDTGIQAAPGEVFYVNENTSQLMSFKSYDELAQYINGNKVATREKSSSRSWINPVLGMSVKTIINHATVGEYIRKLHEKDELVDVIIDVRGEKFPAHRVTLCSHSSYFSNLFSQTKSKKIPFDLKIKGISAHAFASFLEFCYTGEITVYPEIAADLLIVADYLQVKRLKQRCSLIAENLPIDQALKFIVNSSPNNTHKLYQNLFKNVLKNFGSAVKFDEFLEMDIETLCSFISSDDLVIESELEVFQATVRWIAHNIEDRVKYTMRLMGHIRFGHMTSSDLHACAETTGLIRNYDKFREIMLIANWQISCNQLGRYDPFKFPSVKPRYCFTLQTEMPCDAVSLSPPMVASSPKQNQTTPTLVTASQNMDGQSEVTSSKVFQEDLLLISGSQSTGEPQAEFVERYDIKDNQWLKFCKLPVSRKDHVVVALKNELFLIGGSELSVNEMKSIASCSVYMLNTSTKVWTRVADMLTPRYSHCACVARGKIYVIGGKDRDTRVLKSVECYDLNTDTWTEIAAINSPRYGACASMYLGKIFVTGGLGEDIDVPSTLPVLNTVECYDIDTESWSRLNNLRFPRCYGNLVRLNDRIFLCCGATRSFNYRSSVLVSLSSIDEYDVANDVWTHVTDMVIPRHHAGVAATGDRLYILGGRSTVTDRCLQSVECFDPRTGKWISGVSDLPEPASSIGCVSMTSKWQTEDHIPARI